MARPLGAFQSQMDKDQTTTPGTTYTRPTLYDKCVASLTSPANQYNEMFEISLNFNSTEIQGKTSGDIGFLRDCSTDFSGFLT